MGAMMKKMALLAPLGTTISLHQELQAVGDGLDQSHGAKPGWGQCTCM